MSRRSFITGAAAVAATAGVVGLAGCSSKSGTAATTLATSTDGGATLKFLAKPAAIADSQIKATKEFDVVVVGAGASGVPAALSALEAGAKVAVLQKESKVISQGNSGTGIDLAKSDPAGVEALVARCIKDNDHRASRKLLEVWAKNSGEAVKWVIAKSLEGGATVIDQANLQQGAILKVNGYSMNYVTSFFGPKPYTAGDGMQALAKTAAKAGVEFFYSTKGVQLVLDGSGAVTGVIGQASDGTYTKFSAKKGVILACGDYENNEEMSNYFLPDIKNYERKQLNKTGDGHIMGYWAGAVIENIGHTKMLHDFDAGPSTMCDMPFLAVDQNGERFVNETAEMSILNNYLKQKENAGWYSQIFDSTYMTQAATWPGRLVDPEGMKVYMPEEKVERKGVFEGFIGTYKADTLEALATKLKIDPTKFAASVKRYNDLVAGGKDLDFGKQAEYLKPIKTPPFYGIHRHLRVSAICSGLVVDEHSQCLNADGKPIKGLFSVGNQGGGFYGGVDYPLTVFGLSLGRCYTFGYVTGKYVAKL
ncbi:MAG: FAD-binding protein [Coriobacteriia bacterium]|nr:FAD-binding protein [Coriobacteriia bacterium]